MIDHELTIGIGYYSDEFLSLQGPQGIQLLSNEEIWMFSLETNLNSATFHDIPWHLMIALGAYWFLALLIMLEMPPSGILPGTDPPQWYLFRTSHSMNVSKMGCKISLYNLCHYPHFQPQIDMTKLTKCPHVTFPAHPSKSSHHKELKVAFTNVFTEVPGSPIFLMKMVSKADPQRHWL